MSVDRVFGPRLVWSAPATSAHIDSEPARRSDAVAHALPTEADLPSRPTLVTPSTVFVRRLGPTEAATFTRLWEGAEPRMLLDLAMVSLLDRPLAQRAITLLDGDDPTVIRAALGFTDVTAAVAATVLAHDRDEDALCLRALQSPQPASAIETYRAVAEATVAPQGERITRAIIATLVDAAAAGLMQPAHAERATETLRRLPADAFAEVSSLLERAGSDTERAQVLLALAARQEPLRGTHAERASALAEIVGLATAIRGASATHTEPTTESVAVMAAPVGTPLAEIRQALAAGTEVVLGRRFIVVDEEADRAWVLDAMTGTAAWCSSAELASGQFIGYFSLRA